MLTSKTGCHGELRRTMAGRPLRTGLRQAQTDRPFLCFTPSLAQVLCLELVGKG
jgi:hypothetical protein